MGYTLAQVHALSEGHVKFARIQEKRQVNAVRLAVWGDPADLKAYFRDTPRSATPPKSISELSADAALRPALEMFGFALPPKDQTP